LEKIPGTGLALSGYASWESGQLVKGYDAVGPNEHAWIQKGFIGLLIEDAVTNNFRIIVQGEGMLQFSYRINTGFVENYRATQAPQTNYTLKRGEGILTFGDTSSISGIVECGFFPYKYNSDVRNLGEYLFRTFPYPQFIDNVFDRPYANLLGLRVGTSLGTQLHVDLLFTSEIQNYPLEDFSLSFVADYKPFKGIDFGAGINFDRLFPVNKLMTTPSFVDNNRYITPDNDTGYYTYAGTKIMGRASFDPKPYLPSQLANMFGSEDLKIYTEASILGLKNYPDKDNSTAYYTNLSERTPVTVGLNFPAFKMLDVFAIELEYFNNKYPNSYVSAFEAGTPRPKTDSPFKEDNLKWSFYAKRSIGKHFSTILQVAHDHLIPLTNSLAGGQQDRTDVLLRHGDWWWTAKTQFEF
jgi:hypothetical protein